MPWSDGGSDRPLALPLPFPALGFERNGSLQLTVVIHTRVKAPVLNERIDELMQPLGVWSLVMPAMPAMPAKEEAPELMRLERNANEVWLGMQIRAIAGFELQRNNEKQPRGHARSTPKRRHGRAHGNVRRRVAGRARGKGSVMLESCGLSDGGELEVWRGTDSASWRSHRHAGHEAGRVRIHHDRGRHARFRQRVEHPAG